MFDVPISRTADLSWSGEVPIEGDDWSVGLIAGPSGAGKSTVARELFGSAALEPPTWGTGSVIDEFSLDHSVADISAICQSVGFNTVPAWLRPYHVLSTGEKFRVDLARRMLECPIGEPIVVDEFTSVVDRQVAKIGSHAVQKWVRRTGRQFVGVSCHYDVTDWLQPDWVFEPATMTFTRRSVQPRPRIPVCVAPAPYAAWRLFAPFHYLTAELNKSARCWVLYAGEDMQPAAFAGVLNRPHPRVNDVYGVSRLVTLPDWQGLGLAFVLADHVGGLYRAAGRRLRTYPAHPALIHAFDRSAMWSLKQRPGGLHPNRSGTLNGKTGAARMRQGERPNAVFEYAGPAMEDREEAARMLNWWKS